MQCQSWVRWGHNGAPTYLLNYLSVIRYLQNMISQTQLWRPIPGLDGYYASCYGDILSLRNREPLILTPALDSKGYQVVNIRRIVRRVHRLVAAAFLGLDIEDSATHVLHADDDPTNNNVSNLSLGTHSDNMRDMHSKGRGYKPAVKITDQQVATIRLRLANGERGKHLAKEYNVSPALISHIRTHQRRSEAA